MTVCLSMGGTAHGYAAAPTTLHAKRTPHARVKLLSCGGPTAFRPSVLKRPRGYERRSNPAARALNAFLKTDADEVGQPRHGWFLLFHRGNTVEFLAGKPPEYGAMTFERNGGVWQWVGSGGCEPRAYRRGLTASPWRLDPTFPKPGPSATRIRLHVTPDFCNSGRDARGLVRQPYVYYGKRTVGVTFYVKSPRGIRTCPSSAPTEVVLVLDQPLGKRKLTDRGAYRPAPR